MWLLCVYVQFNTNLQHNLSHVFSEVSLIMFRGLTTKKVYKGLQQSKALRP